MTIIVTFGAITDTWTISIYIHIMDINTTGCILPNKIPQTNIVAFGAITDAWNVSIYIHIMDIITTGYIPPNKIPQTAQLITGLCAHDRRVV